MAQLRIAVVTLVTLLATGAFCAEEQAEATKQEATKPDIYEQAKVCPHRFHMGCMLDVVEKSCTGQQTIEACIKKGKGKCNLDELQRLVGALNAKHMEALNKCCCTKAFQEGYEDCKNPDPVCKKAIADHVGKDLLATHLKPLKNCLKKRTQSACKDALESAKAVSAAVQKARGELWKIKSCEILASPEPISACGWDVKSTPRAIQRVDLYCDAIIWQFKEMGASDPYMAQCKDAPKMPENAEGDQEGEEPEGEEQEEEELEGGNDGEEPEGRNEEGEEPEGEEEGEEEGDGKMDGKKKMKKAGDKSSSNEPDYEEEEETMTKDEL
eukprot:gene18730-20619_t